MKRHAFHPDDRDMSEDYGLAVPAACGRWLFSAVAGREKNEPCKDCVRVVGIGPDEAMRRLAEREEA